MIPCTFKNDYEEIKNDYEEIKSDYQDCSSISEYTDDDMEQ
jgi:hypothetical protein